MLYLVLVMHIHDESCFCELHREVDQFIAFASHDRFLAEKVMQDLVDKGKHSYYQREVKLVECEMDKPIGVRVLDWKVSYVE